MDNDIKPAVLAALEFYADKYNYAPDIEAVTGVNPDGSLQWDASNIETDGGERARDVLKLIER
jgi:hypothetical protein